MKIVIGVTPPHIFFEGVGLWWVVVLKVIESELMHALQYWGCLCWLYRQYNIALLMLGGYVACPPWKCFSSVCAKEEYWAEFCTHCCHFIFSLWQDKWINKQTNKLRNMNFILPMDTNTRRRLYVKKNLKRTFIINTTLLTLCHSDSYMTHYMHVLPVWHQWTLSCSFPCTNITIPFTKLPRNILHAGH
jgi:hypothetical protein